MIDMDIINSFVKFYQDNYPEIRIYYSYDPFEEIVKFDFHAYSFDRYETYSSSCTAYDMSCDLDNSRYVVSKMQDALLKFLSTDVVKAILCKSRLEEM